MLRLYVVKKMLTNTLLVIIVLCLSSDLSLGQSDAVFFRNDYTYIEAINSSYKIHPTPQTWSDAKRECAMEGASLFYPENDDEQNAVMSFRNETQPNIKWMFLGISDIMSEGLFETIDGKAISEVYNNWKSDEPNDKHGDEDCVEQDNAGKMNDCNCLTKFSFICKKSSLSLEQSDSNSKNNNNENGPVLDLDLFGEETMEELDELTDQELFQNDYTYIDVVNSSYKIHTTAQTWFYAKQICAQEGASLFYPENDDEQNAVMSFRNKTQPNIKWMFLGISDIMSEGIFETIDGKAISEVYNNWKSDEPNDKHGDEDCVEQDNAGKMNDCNCLTKFSFICKKSPLSLEQSNSDSTSNNNNNENEPVLDLDLFWEGTMDESDEQKDQVVIPYDYTYKEVVNSSYKIHMTEQTWFDAKQVCAQEGASLFYPENDVEQNAVMSFLNETQPNIKWIFLGISDLVSEGVFETIDGKAISEVYNNWKSDEPNDKHGDEDCVEQDNAGKMNDCKCSNKFPFICKKSPLSLEQNNSDSNSNNNNTDEQTDQELFRNDYTYIEVVNSSYKIHMTQQTWFDAKRECAQEGASLFYPENDVEQNAVMSFLNETHPEIEWIYLGISDLVSEGVFETIDGKAISEVYNNWKPNEPNDNHGDEDCVEQDNAGKMNDCYCFEAFFFICKKSPLSLEQNNSNSNSNNNNKDIQRNKEFFRNDYTYIEAANSFYKIHPTPQTWSDAKRECALEGASLFYPENDDEQNAVMSFRNETQPDIEWVFVGIPDFISEEVFETIDGSLVTEVYNNWNSDEVNNDIHENCLEQDSTGKMNICRCSEKLSFICKKSRSLKRNKSCNIDYSHNKDIGKCYKLHNTALKWTDANEACRDEQSHLAVIRNRLEADYLAKLTESASKQIIGDYHQLFRGIYHLGFHYREKEGWRTVRGTPYTVDDKAWWDNHQPIIAERQQCGSMFYTGRLNSIDCDTKSFFICEHQVDSSDVVRRIF